MIDSVKTVLLVMSLTGLFAGFVRWLWTDDKTVRGFLKQTLLGFVAAFTLPLFLKMISSDLIAKEAPPQNYFVLTGLCLIAAYSAPTYMERLTERIMQQLKENEKKTEEARKTADSAKEQAAKATEQTAKIESQVAPILAKEEEPETEAENEEGV